MLFGKRSICFSKKFVFVCTFSAFLFLALPGVTQAGFIVAPPTSQTLLDGQDTDWITITSNSLGDLGLGTLNGGTLNVGVQPVFIGDFTIEEGASFNADQIGAGPSGSEQYMGTINLGRALIIKTGGAVYLNQDTLNALGRSDTSSGYGMRMSGASLLDAQVSDLNFRDDVSVDNAAMNLNGRQF